MVPVPIKKIASGLTLPVLGAGTWRIGGATEADRSCDREAVASLRGMLEDGFRHFDTAEMYGAGHTEELLGEALRGWPRKELRLTGKVWKTHLTYDGVLRACDDSLRRLGCDYFDLYLIHQVAPEADWHGVLRAFERLAAEKRVRHFGVSNFTPERWQNLQAMTPLALEANQVHYNLCCREAEHAGLLDYCREHDRMLIAWRPLQKGTLALDVPLMRELCEKYGKTPIQVALNFLIAQPQVVTIAAMRDAAHRRENLGATDWMLDAADLERLRNEWPDRRERSEALPLS